MRVCEKCATENHPEFTEFNTRLARCAKCGDMTLCILEKNLPPPKSVPVLPTDNGYDYIFGNSEWW